jgi:hypothetical protein
MTAPNLRCSPRAAIASQTVDLRLWNPDRTAEAHNSQSVLPIEFFQQLRTNRQDRCCLLQSEQAFQPKPPRKRPVAHRKF